MSAGLILLAVVGILILFGVAQRVLDRLRLTDRQALVFTAAMFVGGLIPDVRIAQAFSFNIGGALIPLILCVYLLSRAGSGWEVLRTLIAAALTGAAIYYMGRLLPSEPEEMPFDFNYLYGLAGGALAYLFGRSRRGAFVAGVLGAMIADVWSAIDGWMSGVNQPLVLGGAGAADVIVISGLTAVLLAELVGEIIERMARGRQRDEKRVFDGGDFRERGRSK